MPPQVSAFVPYEQEEESTNHHQQPPESNIERRVNELSSAVEELSLQVSDMQNEMQKMTDRHQKDRSQWEEETQCLTSQLKQLKKNYNSIISEAKLKQKQTKYPEIKPEIRSKIESYVREDRYMFAWEIRDRLIKEGICNKHTLHDMSAVSRLAADLVLDDSDDSSLDSEIHMKKQQQNVDAKLNNQAVAESKLNFVQQKSTLITTSEKKIANFSISQAAFIAGAPKYFQGNPSLHCYGTHSPKLIVSGPVYRTTGIHEVEVPQTKVIERNPHICSSDSESCDETNAGSENSDKSTCQEKTPVANIKKIEPTLKIYEIDDAAMGELHACKCEIDEIIADMHDKLFACRSVVESHQIKLDYLKMASEKQDQFDKWSDVLLTKCLEYLLIFNDEKRPTQELIYDNFKKACARKSPVHLRNKLDQKAMFVSANAAAILADRNTTAEASSNASESNGKKDGQTTDDGVKESLEKILQTQKELMSIRILVGSAIFSSWPFIDRSEKGNNDDEPFKDLLSSPQKMSSLDETSSDQICDNPWTAPGSSEFQSTKRKRASNNESALDRFQYTYGQLLEWEKQKKTQQFTFRSHPRRIPFTNFSATEKSTENEMLNRDVSNVIKIPNQSKKSIVHVKSSDVTSKSDKTDQRNSWKCKTQQTHCRRKQKKSRAYKREHYVY